MEALLVEVAKSVLADLQARGKPPVRLRRNWLIAPDSRELRAPVALSTEFWIETNHYCADHVKHACRLIQEAGRSVDDYRTAPSEGSSS